MSKKHLLVLLLPAAAHASNATNATNTTASPRPRPPPRGGGGSSQYESILRPLWDACDTDGSGDLSIAEWRAATERLGIQPEIFTQHNQNLDTLYYDLRGSSSSGLTQSDLAGAVTRYPMYREPLLAAFSNGATSPPGGEMLAPPTSAVTSARATVTTVITVAGPPTAIYAGTRSKITRYFARTAGIPPDAVSITFLPREARRRHLMDTHAPKAPTKRELQAASETDIEAIMFLPTDAAADRLTGQLPTSATDFASIPAFNEVSVTAVTTTSTELAPPLPVVPLGAVVGGLVVVGFVLCCNACFWSGKKRKKMNKPADCCRTGCCSFYAVKSWSFGELLACLAVVGVVFNLYNNITGLTNAILGLIDVLVELVEEAASIPQIASFTNAVPEVVIVQMREQRSLLELMPLAVMVPGLLAAILLLLGSSCPLYPGHKGSYCCSKCIMLLAFLILMVALGFYFAFAIVGVVLAVAPPQVMEIIMGVRGMCVTIPASLSQVVSDGTMLLEQMAAAGQSDPDTAAALETATTVTGLINDGCDNLVLLMDEATTIFLPAALCVAAIYFAIWVNFTLCCAAGCCAGPPKEDKPDDDKAHISV